MDSKCLEREGRSEGITGVERKGKIEEEEEEGLEGLQRDHPSSTAQRLPDGTEAFKSDRKDANYS